MKSDAQIRDDVMSELAWDPAITVTDVGVIVRDGVVTLTGHPSSHAEKYAIEQAAQRVAGVHALAVEMSVKLPSDHERSDADIAAAAERALEWNVLVPDDKIKVLVENGFITMSGKVEWDYQRRAADAAVRDLFGVTGVANQIVVKPKVTPTDIALKIQNALERHADREARRIEITVNGADVTLKGRVHSWAERSAAQGAAWSAPGVANVVNNLMVDV